MTCTQQSICRGDAAPSTETADSEGFPTLKKKKCFPVKDRQKPEWHTRPDSLSLTCGLKRRGYWATV